MSSDAKGSVDPRWRSGRSPATPDRLRGLNVPHSNPLCNTIVVTYPTFLEVGLWRRGKYLQIGGVVKWVGGGKRPHRGARPLASLRFAAFLASREVPDVRFGHAPRRTPRSHLAVPARRRLRRLERVGG